MSNPFFASAPGPESPALDVYPVTPADGADLATPVRAILIQTDGTLRVTTSTGDVRNYPSGLFALGMFHPIFIRRIHATGTTAVVWGVV